jgi:SAM-dependent methyltransferase
MKLALKITPQRNTQYANMAEALAIPELLASPLAPLIGEVTPVKLGGQGYLLASMDDLSPSSSNTPDTFDMPSSPQLAILSRLGATSEIYQYFASISDVQGPFLRPLEPAFTPFVPLEMAEARRYKGKTNELFTQVLLNLAIFAGAYSDQLTGRLRILDPLAGGGTTLFLALAYGYDAFGIELDRQDAETTAVFVRQYLQGERIPFKEVDEHGRKAGRRDRFEIGRKGETRTLVLAHGDTSQADLHLREVPGGPHMHAIVGDLPYGIQHFSEVAHLLENALSAWERVLLPGGTLALAWNATRIDRQEIINLLERRSILRVRNEPPYTQLAHAVDRVIKKRDILIAVKE